MCTQHEVPNYDPPDSLTVDAALQAIDTLLDQCGREAADNTACGLIQYVHARWDAIRAERVVYGEAWAEELAGRRRSDCTDAAQNTPTAPPPTGATPYDDDDGRAETRRKRRH